MKTKSLALFLMLALVSWGQTAGQSPAPADKAVPASTTKCACCEKMDMRAMADHKACCHSKKAEGSEMPMASCGKDGNACCGDGAKCMKTSAGSAKSVPSCAGKDHCGAKGKSCCGENAKMACCGSQCGGHNSPGAEEVLN